VREGLGELSTLCLEAGVQAAGDRQQREAMYRQVSQLMDLLLDGYTSQLNSLATGSERQVTVGRLLARERAALIGKLVEAKQYSGAASLAEKYRDLGMLVRICEETGDQERLAGYVERFREQGFSRELFSWYLGQGKQARLLGLTKLGELGSFLAGHEALSWVHSLHTGEYEQAGQVLASLASREQDRLARKKTQLSLAKLSLLAGEGEEEGGALGHVEKELSLVAAQEQLPDTVLGHYGFDKEAMRVLSPREMIELYISSENVEADYIDFKKALDLLSLTPGLSPEERRSVWLHIWARALVISDWGAASGLENPLDTVRDTTFFRLAEFAFMQGEDLSSYLPPQQELLASEELAHLSQDNSKQYLIKVGYEHINQVCVS